MPTTRAARSGCTRALASPSTSGRSRGARRSRERPDARAGRSAHAAACSRPRHAAHVHARGFARRRARGPRLGRALRDAPRVRGARPRARPRPQRGARAVPRRHGGGRGARRAHPAASATTPTSTRPRPGRRSATGSPSIRSPARSRRASTGRSSASCRGGTAVVRRAPGDRRLPVAGPRRERRRRLRRDVDERRLQPAAPRALPRRGLGVRRDAGRPALEGRPRRGRRELPRSPPSRSPAGVEVVAVSAITGAGPRGRPGTPRARAGPSSSPARPASASRAS